MLTPAPKETSSRPILVLGMHRSGTSCLAAMLVAAGARVEGESVRNWDNPRGHHEANALVRLNEDVLSSSGGHWLDPPDSVSWTDAQAAERERLLAAPGATVWKDPRSLLVWPFWASTGSPFQAVGVLRHPLSVARSLLAWRSLAIDDGLRLWLAHVQALAASGAPVLVFDQPREDFVASVSEVARQLGLPHPENVASGYAAELVHHSAGDGPEGDPRLLEEALDLFHRLGGVSTPSARPFPWDLVREALDALSARRLDEADEAARKALVAGADKAAVAAPLAAAWLHAHQGHRLLSLLDRIDLPLSLSGLLRGKALLDARRPAEAALALKEACSTEAPLFEARHLLPLALWEAGEQDAADEALAALLPLALYPFRVHARRAEWAWQRRDEEAALAHLEAAIASAPSRRQGRLLHRRATWREARGDSVGAAADRTLAYERDPSYRPGRAS